MKTYSNPNLISISSPSILHYFQHGRLLYPNPSLTTKHFTLLFSISILSMMSFLFLIFSSMIQVSIDLIQQIARKLQHQLYLGTEFITKSLRR